MVDSITARYFYFHSDDEKEIRNFWQAFGKSNGIDVKSAYSGIPSTLQGHGLIEISHIEKENNQLFLRLFKNTVIVIGISKNTAKDPASTLEDTEYQDFPGMEKCFGGAVFVTSDKKIENISSRVGMSYTQIKTNVGALYQFEEKEGFKKHMYVLLNPVTDSKEIEHMLTHHFPPFDFSIHRLHIERDYFKNQRHWIIQEKQDIDKTVGDILHKRIVGETLNPENIGTLESEIDTLSDRFAKLVNDGHLVRKSITALEEGISAVSSYLEKFGSLNKGESLKILEDSIKLKETLEEDNRSITFAIKNTKTAMDTVRTNVDLLRSRENIMLQEEAISFQVAAGVLAFIIIFYYSLTSWLHIIGEHRFDLIPPTVRFFTIFFFTLFAVILTHFVGISFKNKWKLNNGMILSGLAMFGVFIYVIYLSIQTGQAPAPHL